MSKLYTFDKQLSIGEQGELFVQRHWPNKLVKSNDYAYDLLCTDTGSKLEVKTDSYSMTKTPNFFFERWSVKGRKDKPGGPWRAKRDALDVFIYLYSHEGIYFSFSNIPELVTRLDKLTEHMRPVEVRNKNYMTVGYKVRREELSDLYTIHNGYIPNL